MASSGFRFHKFAGLGGRTFKPLVAGDDELHLSAGVGLVFRSFQIDLAIDLSELRDTASMSAIYSF